MIRSAQYTVHLDPTDISMLLELAKFHKKDIVDQLQREQANSWWNRPFPVLL
jgi:hypothetical protein